MKARGLVFLLAAAAACGPVASQGTQGGDASTRPDGARTHDGGPGDAAACQSNCSEPGAQRCSVNETKIRICTEVSPGCLKWQVQEDCASQGKVCDPDSTPPVCVALPSCTDGIQNQDETDVDCGGSCEPCPEGGGCATDEDCASGYCANGTCKLCRAGTFRCRFNDLQQCAQDESSWHTLQHCDVNSFQVCDPSAGTCRACQAVGTNTPTGVYYQYAEFCTSGGVFLGGFDVGSLDNYLFVNRDGSHIDVYQVEILDSDGDGVIEPNQHPENPDAQGPMEERRLHLVQTYDVPVSDGAFPGCTGGWRYCSNEIQPFTDALYFISQRNGSLGIARYDLNTGQTQLVIPWPTQLGCDEVLGHDPIEDVWYVATYDRRVFAYDQVNAEWSLAFCYPNLSGVHTDGLEVVVDPNTGIPYVYVSDMTSDFLAQYRKRADGSWEQTNVFQYNRGQGDYIEGMGFGALSHFWMSAVVDPSRIHETNCIYEIGGGDLTQYTENWDPTHQ